MLIIDLEDKDDAHLGNKKQTSVTIKIRSVSFQILID